MGFAQVMLSLKRDPERRRRSRLRWRALLTVLATLTACDNRSSMPPAGRRVDAEYVTLFTGPVETCVSPSAIQELRGSIADRGPVTAAVDIKQCAPLQNTDAHVSKTEDGYVHSRQQTEHFSYKYLGVTDSQIAVLNTCEFSDNGTGVFRFLVFLRIEQERFLCEDEWTNRRLLRCVGVASSGGPMKTRFAIKGNHVVETELETGRTLLDLELNDK